MQKRSYACAIALGANLWFVSPASFATELQGGQTLHDEECVICHDSSVYTRENRRMQTLKDLKARVDLCQQDVGAEWSPAQIDDVVGYLNDSFYHFTNAAPATP